jgi:predicted molibdopterin-dependent oxidoreductase YjgC
VTSRRGRIEVPARISDIRSGTIFAPFHYGYWDRDGSPGEHPTAANELTITEWDPVSKQPVFKNAAVKVEKIGDATGPAPAPSTTASRPSAAAAGPRSVHPTAGGREGQATERIGGALPPRFPEAIGRSGQDGRP